MDFLIEINSLSLSEFDSLELDNCFEDIGLKKIKRLDFIRIRSRFTLEKIVLIVFVYYLMILLFDKQKNHPHRLPFT